MTAREYLERVREAEARAERLRQRAENLRMLLTDTAMHLRDVPESRGTDLQRNEAIYAEIDALERESREAEEEAQAIRAEVGLAICRIEDPVIQRVLMMRYLEGMKWREVAAKIGCCIAQVYRYRDIGYAELEKTSEIK